MIDREMCLVAEQQLTAEAYVNSNQARGEAERRLTIGLTGTEKLQADTQVRDYLERIKALDPQVDALVDSLVQNKQWIKAPALIACMPVVGTGNQEAEAIQNTLLRLSTDPLIQSGDIGVLIFANRPYGYIPDSTATVAESLIQQIGLNALVFESSIPQTLGNSDGPFCNEMTSGENEVPIGLIRDMLSIAAMKVSLRSTGTVPLLLQMDADFEGFMQGSFETILDTFSDPSVGFLQCTSDWDSQEFPTKSDKELLLGAQLMRGLPQILKMGLNNPSLSLPSRQQIIFGEAIQRGIQVPQVERMEAVARKGGYGLNRLAHDELDANIRQSALLDPGGMRSTADVTFLWNNRRAVRTWQEYKQPPISQWVNPFAVIDPVRSAATATYLNGQSHLEAAVNTSLARFPIPRRLIGVYDDFTLPVRAVLERYFPDSKEMEVCVLRKSSELYYLQVNFQT